MRIEKVEKLTTIYMLELNTSFNNKFKVNIKSWIDFEKVHRVIKFKSKSLAKPYIVRILS